MWELTKSFRFEAAHALSGTTLGEASEEIHGHSFRAEVVIRGTPDPSTGMLADLTRLEKELEALRSMLDHKLLNRVERLGLPTLEKPVAVHLGAGAAHRPRRAGERSPRLVRRVLHVLRPRTRLIGFRSN
jgi:6-pyruvoyl tetrahydropterin synthase/QueD family protein